MIRDTDPTPAHGIARPGVAYVIRRGPRFDPVAAARGVLRPGGEYWHGWNGRPLAVTSDNWGPADGARMFTPAERAKRESFPARLGGMWMEIIIEIPAD